MVKKETDNKDKKVDPKNKGAKPNTNNKPKKETKKNEIKKINYNNIVASCACGAKFETGSTLDKIRVDICSNCHPFYTGENKILDTEGRVEKFKKRSQYQKKAKA